MGNMKIEIEIETNMNELLNKILENIHKLTENDEKWNIKEGIKSTNLHKLSISLDELQQMVDDEANK